MFVFLLLPSLALKAEIFQWTDSAGNKHFSDKAHDDASVLHISPGYSYYGVKKVYDGDTILLENGNKVRLLGINTPEVEGRNKSAQAGGEKARLWLQSVLKNKKVRLEADAEKKDKYGRLLRHVFSEDNRHINLELVNRGLASVNIHPPNLKYVTVLLGAQQLAEKNSLGIWKEKEYAPKSATDIRQGRFKGWQRVIGTIKNSRQTRKYAYLQLSDTFSIKIALAASQYFPPLEQFVGKQVEVRGWINRYKKKYTMFIRHPGSLIFKSHI